MASPTNRRPVRARNWKVIQQSAHWLSRKRITPNQISLASIAFAALSGLCLIGLPGAEPRMVWLLSLLAILFILCRALCNVLDGLVAIEGGKRTPSGELFNDIPDRVADALIIVSAGYATGVASWGPALGWCAGLLAVMTAYVRTLARSMGAPSDFQGPMAKVPRMVVIALGAGLTSIEALFGYQGTSLFLALILIVLGCMATIWNRARSAYLYLEGRGDA